MIKAICFQEVERIITRLHSYTSLVQSPKGGPFATILAYHEICSLSNEISRLHPYNVTPSAFKEQMVFLWENGYSVMSLEDLISCLRIEKDLPHKSVVITFDDGYKSAHTNAFPILKKYGFPATIFLATNYIGSDEIFPWLNHLVGRNQRLKSSFMPLAWEEVVKMSEDSIAFGSHTCTHSNIRTTSKKDFEDEIRKSKRIIENKTSKKVTLFSYPFSFPKYRRSYRDVVDAAKDTLRNNGFLGACTTIIGTNSLKSDPFCLKRIQIKNTDDLSHFKAKTEGAYNWAGLAQKMYQKFLEPVL